MERENVDVGWVRSSDLFGPWRRCRWAERNRTGLMARRLGFDRRRDAEASVVKRRRGLGLELDRFDAVVRMGSRPNLWRSDPA
ncbi:hypothetical protein M0R45_019096 [Rubus argutus]|uniref:Uncharacterized protein n=1 Tax=Rubus argutus TaxID=59490 RepID=A0AAW1X6D4_RUBAR